MRYDAILFDVYGTLIDIHTDERRASLWMRLARFLRYQGVPAEPQILRELFFTAARASQRTSAERFPEADLLAIWGALLGELGYRGPDEVLLPIVQLFRSLSVRRFGLFPDTARCLAALRPRFAFGLVSDAQRAFLLPELAMLGLAHQFDTIVISSDFGYRKPDTRLFARALEEIGVAPDRAVYVGDNPFRDVDGAHGAGMAAVLLLRPGAPSAEGSARPPDATIASLDELPAWLAR